MKISWLTKENPLLVEAGKAERKFHPALTLLFFFGLYAVSLLLAIPFKLLYLNLGGPDTYFSVVYELTQVLTIIVFCLFVVKVEKRSLRSMGFIRKEALWDMLKGIGLYFLFNAVRIGIILLTGNGKITGFGSHFSLGVSSLLLIPVFIQAFSEEVIARGYLVPSLANRMNALWAIFISAVAFSALHSLNTSNTWMNYLAYALHGLILTFLFLRTGNLWAATGFHWFWNWGNSNLISYWGGSQQLLQIKQNGTFISQWDELILTIVFLLAILFWPKKDTKSCRDLVS